MCSGADKTAFFVSPASWYPCGHFSKLQRVQDYFCLPKFVLLAYLIKLKWRNAQFDREFSSLQKLKVNIDYENDAKFSNKDDPLLKINILKFYIKTAILANNRLVTSVTDNLMTTLKLMRK